MRDRVAISIGLVAIVIGLLSIAISITLSSFNFVFDWHPFERHITLTMTPTTASVAPGVPVVIRWRSSHAQKCSATWKGPVPTSGQATVMPDFSIMVPDYESVVCYNIGGSATEAHVIITPKVPAI
jgi:hypothetical protein